MVFIWGAIQIGQLALGNSVMGVIRPLYQISLVYVRYCLAKYIPSTQLIARFKVVYTSENGNLQRMVEEKKRDKHMAGQIDMSSKLLVFF